MSHTEDTSQRNIQRIKVGADNLHRSTNNLGSLQKSKSSNEKKKQHRFFKIFNFNWHHFGHKLKEISQEAFGDNESLSSLFEEEGSLSSTERMYRADKGYMDPEERFLKEYKIHQSLQKLYDSHNVTETTTDITSSRHGEISQQEVFLKINNYLKTGATNVDAELSSSPSAQESSYKNLDVFKLREMLEDDIEGSDISDSEDSPDSRDIKTKAQSNIGEILWSYRRNEWLRHTAGTTKDIEAQKRMNTLSNVPLESYSKIYTNLVIKGKPLRQDKRINLRELIKVINSGWISEAKWERAAKGLP